MTRGRVSPPWRQDSMHPAFFQFWNERRRHPFHAGRHAHPGAPGCGPFAGGPSEPPWGFGPPPGFGGGGGGGGAGFGVRRPLRFLAHKLDLDEAQVEKLAKLLDDLKTERAQAEVDERRALSSIAAALEGETFDAEAAEASLRTRTESTERVQKAVHTALIGIHAALQPEQRTRFAYLLRTGALTL